MDLFKSNLITLLDKVKNDESEEHQKNNIRDFLLNTYYKGNNEINTKGTQDLVIHTDRDNKITLGIHQPPAVTDHTQITKQTVLA